MKVKLFGILISFCLLTTSTIAQKATAKFGDITEKDFATKLYAVDSNTNAVIIADIGTSKIVGNVKASFSLEFKHYRRVHLLNKNGFDIATQTIPLFSQGLNEAKLSNVKAVTYNIENGKVVETKLDKESIFEDRLDENVVLKKFTFPNIKEGSIIEFEYTVTSNRLFDLQPWAFQGNYPRLWTEYNLRLPSFFRYAFISQGYQRYTIQTKKESTDTYSISESTVMQSPEHYSISSPVTDYRWVMKDVTPLKEQVFTSTLKNHIQKIEFELIEQVEPMNPHVYLKNWPQVARDLMNNENFGLQLTRNIGWLGDVVRPVISGAGTPMGKAKKIYNYVRDNFTCTTYSDLFLDQTLKNVLKTKKGTVSEINLLLTAMMKYADISADPVVLSTKSNGYLFTQYPIIAQLNYVICGANIEGRPVFLDATRPLLGFGKLTIDCYNGAVIPIDSLAIAVNFSADSMLERKATSVTLNANENSELIGTVQQQPGYYESYGIREIVKEKGKDDFFKEIKKGFAGDINLINPHIDSLNNLEESISIDYEFKLNIEKGNIIYINPLFNQAYKENPFKSTERFYPVEMPYKTDEIYVFNMTVPENYMVDELPKSVITKLNEEGDGKFEYLFSEANGIISMRSRIQLKRTFFGPDEYDKLREFFNFIVKKHSEQIVLKKKK